MEQNKQLTGHFSVLFTILIWGTTFISTKILLKSFLPIEILFFRFTLGLLALVIVYPRRLNVGKKSHEWLFACAGLCGVTLYYLLENISLSYSMASNVGVIISIAPFFSAIFSHWFLDRVRWRPSFFLGFATALCGIVLISFNGKFLFKLNPLGDFLALLAAIVWAIYSVLTRKIGSFGYNTIAATRRTFFYGLLFMLPALPVFHFRTGWERFAEPVNLINILFLGLAASALCFVTWNLGVKLLGVVKTSLYIYLVPVITVTASAIILHEKLTWMAIAGTVLTLTGLFLSEGKIRFGKKGVRIFSEF